MTESSFNREDFAYIDENYKRIKQQIADAAKAAGAHENSIRLMGASKTVAPAAINHAISIGLNCIGENRVQELTEKYPRLELENCDCQFIGRLQTNKIKYLLDKVSQIQSIDNMGQIRELARLLEKRGSCMNLLIEVNIGKEENKGGIMPEKLLEFVDEARQYRQIHINGLMAVPPAVDEIPTLMGYFEQMRKYFIDIEGKKMDNVDMNILSMGMSGDYCEAIACGANMVRVGSALFGKRN